MQIFVLDNDPVVAASILMDCHIIKQSLESLQMLSTTQQLLGGVKPDYVLYPGVGYPAKVAYPNHPCTLWVRTSRENYDWLCSHALAITKEYTARYGKITVNEKNLTWCRDNAPPKFPRTGLTPFALAIPEDLKDKYRDPIIAYKEYYKLKREDPFNAKSKLGKWRRNKPDWW